MGMSWGDVLGIEKANSAGKTLFLHPSIHPPSCCLSKCVLSHCCAPGPEQGGENKMVKKMDRVPAFSKLTGQWTMGMNHR